MNNFDVWLDRNLQGIELEKCGQEQSAIRLYELNVADNCEGSHPYDRLAILYRKQKRYDEEIRVLEHAIYVFENLVNPLRGDRLPKLERYKKRLLKAIELHQKYTL